MAFMKRIIVLGMSCLVNPAVGLEDTLVLIQQRVLVEHQPSTSSLATILEDSFSANPKAYDNIIDKVVSHAGEERLHQFWEKLVEIGQKPNVSRAQRGLMLLQEAGQVIGAQGQGATEEDLWVPDLPEWMKRGKSEPQSCWITRGAIVADIGDLTISIAYLVATKCKKNSLCAASSLDVLRAAVFTIREWLAKNSYCGKSVNTDLLCTSSFIGIWAELTGMSHSAVSLGYKCDSNYKHDDSSKIFGVDTRKAMCVWDITRGAAYFVAGLYRAGWWILLGRKQVYTNKEGNNVRLVRGMEEIGQSSPSYFFMAVGGFAWMANAIVAGTSTCPDGKSTSVGKACGREIAELTAYGFQCLGYIQNWRDYCKDSYGKNEAREEAGTEEAYKNRFLENWEVLLKKYVDNGDDLNPDEEMQIAKKVLKNDPEKLELVTEKVRKSVIANVGAQPRRPSVMNIDTSKLEEVYKGDSSMSPELEQDLIKAIDTALTPKIKGNLLSPVVEENTGDVDETDTED